MQLLHKNNVDICLLQEHRVKPVAQARTAWDLRSAGWQASFSPPRACGFGEMILVHRRYSARLLQDSDQVCSVALRLAEGSFVRIASLYVPIKKRGPRRLSSGSSPSGKTNRAFGLLRVTSTFLRFTLARGTLATPLKVLGLVL